MSEATGKINEQKKNMDLLFYLVTDRDVHIRAADQQRNWMNETRERFAYRCLPLNIANAHGWEICCSHGFSAEWDGGEHPSSVHVTPDLDSNMACIPTGHFGFGTITFHVDGLLRTPAGWNLWVGGPVNQHKDGIAPLSGVVETDWAPFTFTMNWKFTRPGHKIRFEKNEPFCFFFPIPRGSVEHFKPVMRPIHSNPDLWNRYQDWSRSRDQHIDWLTKTPPQDPAAGWQKHYFRGVDVSGCKHIDDHQTKLRLPEFVRVGPASLPLATPSILPPAPAAEIAAPPPGLVTVTIAPSSPPAQGTPATALAPHESAPAAADSSVGVDKIARRGQLAPRVLLKGFIGRGRPLILTGAVAHWPALSKWTIDYLKEAIGDVPIELQFSGRIGGTWAANSRKSENLCLFHELIHQIFTRKTNGIATSLSTFGSIANTAYLSPIFNDFDRPRLLPTELVLGSPRLRLASAGIGGTMPASPYLQLIAQAAGQQRVHLRPVAAGIRSHAWFGETQPPTPAIAALPLASDLRAGDLLILPSGWEHRTHADGFVATVTFAAALPAGAGATR